MEIAVLAKHLQQERLHEAAERLLGLAGRPDVHVERLIKAIQAANKQEKQEKMRSKMRKDEERV